jgi:hypothetical protein
VKRGNRIKHFINGKNVKLKNGTININEILEKKDWIEWSGFIWLRIGTSDGLL